jgi:FixJ family two-component response regulator
MNGTRTSVAVVDDDESVRRGLRRLLEAHEWRVHTYTSAEEFLEDTMSLDVDIALIDIYLPGLNGIELLKRLQSDGAGLAVILMTAHGESETADALLAAGRTFCLRKPFTFTQLRDAMLTNRGRGGGINRSANAG